MFSNDQTFLVAIYTVKYDCLNLILIDIISSATAISLDNQEKAEFISNFLLWTQGNQIKEEKNCLLLNFGSEDLPIGLSQLRRVI